MATYKTKSRERHPDDKGPVVERILGALSLRPSVRAERRLHHKVEEHIGPLMIQVHNERVKDAGHGPTPKPGSRRLPSAAVAATEGIDKTFNALRGENLDRRIGRKGKRNVVILPKTGLPAFEDSHAREISLKRRDIGRFKRNGRLEQEEIAALRKASGGVLFGYEDAASIPPEVDYWLDYVSPTKIKELREKMVKVGEASGHGREVVEDTLRNTGLYNHPFEIADYFGIKPSEWVAQRDGKDTSEIDPDDIVPEPILYQIDYLLRIPARQLDQLVFIEQQDQNRP